MKAEIIALMLVAIVHTGLSQPTQQTTKPATPRPIDLRAMRMQEAVLRTKDIHQVEELLKQGVDINAPIGCGTYSPLDGAVDRENLQMLEFFLAHGAKPKGRELANAAFINNPQVALGFVKLLLTAGVNPNATNYYSTPLTSAAYRGHRKVVVLLLSQPGIEIDAQDVDGYTALMWAAEHGSMDLVDLLVNAGAIQKLKTAMEERPSI